jgi:hypothetical protein
LSFAGVISVESLTLTPSRKKQRLAALKIRGEALVS